MSILPHLGAFVLDAHLKVSNKGFVDELSRSLGIYVVVLSEFEFPTPGLLAS
jgi:hypothetical protein